MKHRKKYTRRPSSGKCGHCGISVGLAPCGVDEHLWNSKIPKGIREDPRNNLTCNGRVYIHIGDPDGNGGMDCPDRSGNYATCIDKHGNYWR